MAHDSRVRVAFGRSSTFPITHQESKGSPFSLRQEDDRNLESSEGFQIIRKFLANQQSSVFCEQHLPATRADEEAWLLHRDITHALILPTLQIYRQALELAEAFLCTQNPFDLELAFRGEARGAFSWLQCLITEEEDWCSTRGCPACVVSYVLQSEPTIRLVLVSCRLSRSLRKPQTGHKLPLFDFWRASLRRALDNDPFWGPAYSKEMEERAAQLEIGIQQLIRQCCELSEAVSSRGEKTENLTPTACFTPYHAHLDQPSMKRISSSGPPSKIPAAQEEQTWMEKIIIGCWTTLLADASHATKTEEFSEHSCTSPEKTRSMSV